MNKVRRTKVGTPSLARLSVARHGTSRQRHLWVGVSLKGSVTSINYLSHKWLSSGELRNTGSQIS